MYSLGSKIWSAQFFRSDDKFTIYHNFLAVELNINIDYFKKIHFALF